MRGEKLSAGSRWNTALIAALALLVGSVLPSPLPRRPEFGRFGPDKFLHFLGHAGLAVTLADGFGTGRQDVVLPSLFAVGCSSVYGLAIGYLQQYVPGRAAERADTVAGVLGSVSGVLWWYSRRRP